MRDLIDQLTEVVQKCYDSEDFLRLGKAQKKALLARAFEPIIKAGEAQG